MNRFIGKELVHRDRIPKEPPWNLPWPIPTTKNGVFAKCPKCGRITSIRTCYGCKELMCEDCLLEHQITCLRKEATP